MPTFKANPRRNALASDTRTDPFTNLKWWVEIENDLAATFAECSGLTMETEFYEYREGGRNTYALKFPGPTKYTNLILKRGMTHERKLWEWYSRVVSLGERGGNIRKDVRIRLFDPTGQKLVQDWLLLRAFPVKWIGPEFRADSASVAIETLEFVHEGLKEF